MPVARRSSRRTKKSSNGGGIKSILMHSIKDGSSEYHVAVVTNGSNAMVRLRIRDNGEEVATLYLDVGKARELGTWLLHLAALAEHPSVVSELWKLAGHKRVPGRHVEAEATEVHEEAQQEAAEAEAPEESAAEFEDVEFA